MSKRSMELKVGAFVLVGLILTGLMIMRFSKGTGLSGTYELKLESRNAGGIIPGANVLMAGVPVGTIRGIILAPDGSKVTMLAGLYDRFRIPTNAVWSIATVGLLGDRYIAISPGRPIPEKDLTFLKDGDVVNVGEAFEITQAAESASALMDRLRGTVDQLSTAVQRLDGTLLSDQSLSNLTQTIENARSVSERAIAAVENVNSFVATNSVPLNGTITNLHAFSSNLREISDDLSSLVDTNRQHLTAAFENIERVTGRADKIMERLQAGEGLAGNLLSNNELSEHVSLMISNFMVFGDNLNKKGIWGVFRKPKPDK